ncbi:MAG: ATP-dependent carboxylate-amine ligase [Acidobacteriaceae bacterium]|nr:ATP-dependent carboxylate-amine ligase [Acidobacteriaceae bacterium]
MATAPVTKPIAIYYEHPDWFKPLFAELERRNIPHVLIDARRHRYDAGALNGDAAYSLLFNRMSPSAYTRGNGHGIFYTLNYLAHLEKGGVRVVNGYHAFRVETSKAQQLELLDSLKLPYPKARVINHPEQALKAAVGLRYPIVVKPNIGGSGAGVLRFNDAKELAKAIDEKKIDLGLDSTGLVQEFIPAKGNHITRVEVLGGKFLYAIKVHLTGDTYNLCPADICQDAGGAELQRSTCAVDAPKNGLKVEAYRPPKEVIDAVEKIMQTAQIEIGGVEYIEDERDGQLYYYDINALSNFVADGPKVVGFDPFVKLVDYLEQEAR